MKENLKIRAESIEEKTEIQKLFFSIGFGWMTIPHDRINLNESIVGFYASSKILTFSRELDSFVNSADHREITLPELRELARPKEYLNEKFELVVTNQPKEGWLLVPDNCSALTENCKYLLFWHESKKFKCAQIPFTKWRKAAHESFLHYSKLHGSKILWQRNPKETEINTEKKGRFLHQEWYEAFGRGEDVQFKHSTNNQWRDLRLDFHTLNLFNVPDHKFRLKPRTITIGSKTINAPISVKPERNTAVFVANACIIEKYHSFGWVDTEHSNTFLNRGLCHLNKESAIAHCEALLELMKEAK